MAVRCEERRHQATDPAEMRVIVVVVTAVTVSVALLIVSMSVVSVVVAVSMRSRVVMVVLANFVGARAGAMRRAHAERPSLGRRLRAVGTPWSGMSCATWSAWKSASSISRRTWASFAS